ncbi:hypothetical protein [Xylanibacter rodentium]|uniref:hypothetical protein n=1 Tax=Xylanibacter rodentium TaxID=2736289 RepID=UPI002584ED81|nr:hypothetical protein [Xylanibacter rodentium]
MQAKTILRILMLLICVGSMAGCDDDEALSPITLEYENHNVIFDNDGRTYRLTPFSNETTPLYIKGGDGQYKVTNSNENVVHINFDGRKISLQAKDLGDALVRIDDASGNSYALSVVVRYNEWTYTIANRTTIIKGNELTVGDKAELEKKIAAGNNEKGYLFTYKNATNSTGSVRIYDEDGREREYDFSSEQVSLPEDGAIEISNGYKLREYYKVAIMRESINETIYVTKDFFPLIDTRYNNYARPMYCFVKDLTEQYKADYPKAESIYLVYETVAKANMTRTTDGNPQNDN